MSSFFQDLNRLFLFTHLTPTYAGRCWVLVDGDKSGVEVIDSLRKTYSSHDSSRFRNFQKPSFEWYYPAIFSAQVEQILQVQDRQVLRAEKLKLLNEVRAWLDEDSVRAKAALEDSAAEVVNILREIEQIMNSSFRE